MGGGNLPQSRVVSVATGVAGSYLKAGQGSVVEGERSMWKVGLTVAGEKKGQALPGPPTSTAPAFLVKGSSSCIGKTEANTDLGLIVIPRASSGSPENLLEFGSAEEAVCAATSLFILLFLGQGRGLGRWPSLDYDPGFGEFRG